MPHCALAEEPHSTGNAGVFMNGTRKDLAATFVSAAMLFSGIAQAMEIRQFDKMAGQDQNDYIVALINGAEKVLADEGRPDLAAQVEQLFTTKNNGDANTIGMAEFERNLAIVRLDDAKNAENILMIHGVKSKMRWL